MGERERDSGRGLERWVGGDGEGEGESVLKYKN